MVAVGTRETDHSGSELSRKIVRIVRLEFRPQGDVSGMTCPKGRIDGGGGSYSDALAWYDTPFKRCRNSAAAIAETDRKQSEPTWDVFILINRSRHVAHLFICERSRTRKRLERLAF